MPEFLPNRSWRYKGGTLEIPDGWFVYQVDLDGDEPHVIIYDKTGADAKEQKLPIPKSLAYYLTTHFCGSESMRDRMEERGKISVQRAVQKALGIDQ